MRLCECPSGEVQRAQPRQRVRLGRGDHAVREDGVEHARCVRAERVVGSADSRGARDPVLPVAQPAEANSPARGLILFARAHRLLRRARLRAPHHGRRIRPPRTTPPSTRAPPGPPDAATSGGLG